MKRLLSLLLVMALIIPAVPCVAQTASDDVVAWADFSDNEELHNFSYVTFANNSTAISEVNAVTVDGVECWQLEHGDKTEYIRFNIENSVIRAVEDGTEYIIYVDYYDGDTTNEGTGFFSLEYDAIDRKCKFGGMVVLENSGTWKTAEFRLDDAYFGNRMMNRAADFRLTVVPQQSVEYEASPIPVAIKGVRLAETGVKRTVRIVAATEKTGNTFAWDESDKIINNTLINTSDSDFVGDFTFKAVLDGDKTAYAITKRLTVPGGGSIVENISLPLTRCGVYHWIVEVSGTDGDEYDKNCTKIAIIKTDKDGIKNDKAYVGHHLDRYFVSGGENREIVEGIELISKSNAGGIRAEAHWREALPNASSELTFEGTSPELISRLAEQNNLDVTWLLSGINAPVTGSWTSYPDEADEITAYKEYVAFVAQKLKNTATSFEVAHEIDNVNFNPIIDSITGERDATPLEYADLIKETAAALDIAEVDKPLIAYGLTALVASDTWLDPALEGGVLDYLDAVSYHPYTSDYCAEGAAEFWYHAPKLKAKLQNINPKTRVAITELGTSLSNSSYVNGKRSRGANNCRAAIAYTIQGLADFVTHYVFEDKGQFGDVAYEDGFGMVDSISEPLRDDSDAIFIPNDTFLSFTAMNYVLGQSEPWQVFDLGEHISASGFESNKFGKKVVVLNTKGLKYGEEVTETYKDACNITKQVTLDLGTSSVTCFDDFGNETNLTSEDGIYTFMLNERPLYVVGDIAEVTPKEDVVLGIGEGRIVLAPTANLAVYASYAGDYTAELFLPDCVSAARKVVITDGSAVIPMVLNDEINGNSVAEVKICDRDGSCVFFGQITLEQLADAEIPESSSNKLLWTAEYDTETNSFLLEFSEAPKKLTGDMINILDMETLENAEVLSIEMLSAYQCRVNIEEVKANAEYKLTLSGVFGVCGSSAENESVFVYTDDGQSFGIKKVRYDAVKTNGELIAEDAHTENFSNYTGYVHPGENMTNENDYADASDGMWSRGNHTKSFAWWGQGTYVNKLGQLGIDSYSNKNSIAISAIRRINEDGTVVKDGRLKVSFDAAYYVAQEHDGSTFTLYAGDIPVFNISRTELSLYDAQLLEKPILMGTHSFSKSNYGADLEKFSLTFDFLNKKVKLCFGETTKTTVMSNALAENGVSELKFEVRLLNGINPDGTNHNGVYRGNAFVMDNYSDEITGVAVAPTYITDADATKRLSPTVSKINIEFTDRVSCDAVRNIEISDKDGGTVEYMPYLSEDGRILTLAVALMPDMDYFVDVPKIVVSAEGIELARNYTYSFSTASAVRFYDENGNELSEEQLFSTDSAKIEVLVNAPNGKIGKCMYVYAVYGRTDNALKSAEVKELSYNEGDVLTYGDELSIGTDEYAKVFLWNGYDSLCPISRDFTIGN